MSETTLPAASYVSSNARTQGEAKQFFEDVLQVQRETPGTVAETELTISAGVVTPTQGTHKVDTEADAAADDLSTLATANMADGRILIIRAVDATRVVTVKHEAGGAGQIHMANGRDIVLDNPMKCIALQRRGTDWYEVLRHAPINDYIHLADEKAQNTAGGTFTLGAWRTRDLNQEKSDIGGHCTLASNQFTLAAGTYRIRASAPANQVDRHKARLQNITDGTTTLRGTNEFSNYAGYSEPTRSFIVGQFTITSSKTFEIQHYCLSTKTTDGFGGATNIDTEVYTVVELEKVN